MSTPAPLTARQPSSFLLSLYATLLEAGGPLLELYLRRRLKAGREDAARFGERHGIPSEPRPDGFLIWFHAASEKPSLGSRPTITDMLIVSDKKVVLLLRD